MGGTPGVYVEESGPGVQRVSSAVTAFIGPLPGRAEHGPVRVASWADFLDRIGPPPAQPMAVQVVRTLAADGAVLTVEAQWDGPEPAVPTVILHHAVALHFRNGGEAAWIVPTPGAGAADLIAGLAAAEAIGEVTLLALPDAVHLDEADWRGVAAAALATCARSRRLLLMDMPGAVPELFDSWSTSATRFRAALADVPASDLRFGAANAPYLRSTLSHEVDPAAIRIVTARDVGPGGEVAAVELAGKLVSEVPLASVRRAVLELVGQARVTLPPSGVVSGLLARTDRALGAWRPPNGMAAAGISDAALAVTAQDLDLMRNAGEGMAINPLRRLPDRGVEIWGGRTLARDPEQVYVTVRRCLMLVEASLVRGLAPLVFELNTPTTWARARAMAEGLLLGLWRDGALLGQTARDAFFVKVGLGQTMTEADVAEGRMILELGLALVRPAEFIVLRVGQRVAGG